MKKGASNSDISVGTEAWNVADGYTKLKILKNLVFMDRYELVALYGSEEMDYQAVNESELNKRRINGLKYMGSCLRLVLGNVKFAITKQELKKELDIFMQRWEQVDRVLDDTYYYNSNSINHTQTLSINKDLFRYCLDVFREIKDDLNFPLNHSGLIFRENEEIDLDKIERDIVFGG